jgi:hypothetical protein
MAYGRYIDISNPLTSINYRYIMIYPYMVNYGLMSFYMFQTNLSMGDRTELARQVEIRPCGSQA